LLTIINTVVVGLIQTSVSCQAGESRNICELNARHKEGDSAGVYSSRWVSSGDWRAPEAATLKWGHQ